MQNVTTNLYSLDIKMWKRKTRYFAPKTETRRQHVTTVFTYANFFPGERIVGPPTSEAKCRVHIKPGQIKLI